MPKDIDFARDTEIIINPRFISFRLFSQLHILMVPENLAASRDHRDFPGDM